MTILHSILAITFAAFCVWLTVRIINRRERWAMWTSAMLAAVLVGYPLSWGPWFWLASRDRIPPTLYRSHHLYDPLRSILDRSPILFSNATESYVMLWVKKQPASDTDMSVPRLPVD